MHPIEHILEVLAGLTLLCCTVDWFYRADSSAAISLIGVISLVGVGLSAVLLLTPGESDRWIIRRQMSAYMGVIHVAYFPLWITGIARKVRVIPQMFKVALLINSFMWWHMPRNSELFRPLSIMLLLIAGFVHFDTTNRVSQTVSHVANPSMLGPIRASLMTTYATWLFGIQWRAPWRDDDAKIMIWPLVAATIVCQLLLVLAWDMFRSKQRQKQDLP